MLVSSKFKRSPPNWDNITYNFAEFLADARARYQKTEEFLYGKEATLKHATNTPFEECFSVIPALDTSKKWEKTHFAVPPGPWPTPTVNGQWSYTIDLDREVFSIFHRWNFPLSGIPDDWIDKLYAAYRSPAPFGDMLHLVDVTYPKPAVDESHVKLYEEADCTILEVSDTRPGSNAHEGLCFEMLKVCLKGTDNEINPYLYYSYSWGPEDPPFKQLAFVALCLADRSSFSLLQHSPRHRKRFVQTGYQDIDYPATSSYWFAGVFIYLATHLEDDEVRKAAIGHILELTRQCPRSNFTAFLFSLKDLVIIDVSEKGIKHTNVLPFYNREDQTASTPGPFAMIAHLARSRSLLANLRRAQNVTRSRSILPFDILMDIVEYVDWETAVVLSATSKVLRDCVEKARPKCGELNLLEYVGPGTFIGRVGDGRLVEVKLEQHDYGQNNTSSSFLTVMRYPGVRQRDLVSVVDLLYNWHGVDVMFASYRNPFS